MLDKCLYVLNMLSSLNKDAIIIITTIVYFVYILYFF